MSVFNPKLFILKHLIKKKYKEKSENSKNKSKIQKPEKIFKKNINYIIQKSEFDEAFNKYLALKKITYFKELKEEKEPKKEITFDKLNITVDNFARTRNISNNYNIKNGVVSKANKLQKLKIDSTFEKIWKKITPKSYEKYNNEYNFSIDKNKIILRKINKEKEKINSMINLGINSFKNMFGDKIFSETNKNIIENKPRKDPLIFMIRRNTIKKNNLSTNNIKSIKSKKSFFNKTLKIFEDNKIKILKRSSYFRNDIKEMKETRNIDLSRNRSRTIKIKRINKIENDNRPNSELKEINYFEKAKFKNTNKEKSLQERFSRNKNNSYSMLNSGNQKSELYKKYNDIIKTTKQMRLKYLDNNIIPLNQVDSITKIREELMMNIIKMKYLSINKNKPIKKIVKRKKQNDFKERLLKSAELFGNGEISEI